MNKQCKKAIATSILAMGNGISCLIFEDYVETTRTNNFASQTFRLFNNIGFAEG